MGVIQTFERKLQGAVGNTFARLFGGKVQPAEVADALQKEAAEHLLSERGLSLEAMYRHFFEELNRSHVVQ